MKIFIRLHLLLYRSKQDHNLIKSAICCGKAFVRVLESVTGRVVLHCSLLLKKQL